MKSRLALLAIVLLLIPVPFARADEEVINCPGGTPPPCSTPKPTADSKSVTTAYQTAISVQLSGALTPGSPETLQFGIVSNPSSGTLGTIQADNTVTYTPNSGFSGSDSFTYKSIDGQDESDPATVSITVSAAPGDTTAPTFTTQPTDQVFTSATQPISPTLSFPTATDDSGATPTISHSPTSFSFGSTTVVWTATDAAGNTSTTSSKVGAYLRISTTINVPANCSVTDTNGTVHDYTATTSTAYLGICALDTAVENGSITSAQFTNFSFGLFVTSLGGLTADSSSQFWALYHNGGFANVGMTELPVKSGETILFELQDFSSVALGHRVEMTVGTLIATSTPPSSSGGSSGGSTSGGGGGGVRPQFDLPKAIAFLVSNQKADGSYSSALLSDWAAIAFAGGGAGDSYNKLRTYFASNTPALVTTTDYERHAMALQALGLSPFNGSTQDFIDPIVKAFDGTQVGDASLVNDDIFAIFPLLHAGYTTNDEMIQKIAAFIISKQQSNGSWESSVDVTAAAIQALSDVPSAPGAQSALTKARAYLVEKQENTGGFGNEFSTAWAMQGIRALGEASISWMKGYNPIEYLATLQQSDGGVGTSASSLDNRIWATSYAIPAVSAKTWSELLQHFQKPPPPPAPPSSNETPTTTPTTTPATREPVATAVREVRSLVEPFIPQQPSEEPEIVSTSTPTTTLVRTSATPTSQFVAAAGAPGGLDWSWLVYAIAIVAALYLAWALYSLLRDLIRWLSQRAG